MMFGLDRIGRYRVHGAGPGAPRVDAWSPEGRRVSVRLVEGQTRSGLAEAVRRVASVDHPACPPVVEWGAQGSRAWVVRPFVAGETLEATLADGPIPLRMALAVAAEVAGAVGAAHAAGVLVRELGPADVVLADGGGVVLPDLGFAAPRRAWRAAVLASDPRRAVRIAPELARFGQEGPASDLWALGALLAELVAGRPVLAEVAELLDALVSPLPSERPDAWRAAEVLRRA